MAKQSQNKFIKRQKELDRMRRAKKKMERRQGRKNKETESDGTQDPNSPRNRRTIEHQQSIICPNGGLIKLALYR